MKVQTWSFKMKSYGTLAYAAFIMVCASAMIPRGEIKQVPRPIVWKMQDPKLIGNFHPDVLGNPVVLKKGNSSSIAFNGINDGLIIPTIPVKGWSRFTIEVHFNPAGDGPAAPRFMHFQDIDNNRGTMEVRVTPQGTWYLDTFLKNGKTNEGLTLIDSTKQHPGDKWYWVAMVYDGKKMTSYVNAEKELEGDVNFVPVTTGQISLGVRLNKVNWFKGQIGEIRFHPAALDRSALQR